MKSAKKLLSGILALSMLSGVGFTASSNIDTPVSAATVDDTCDDWLHAEGSRLYDMNGNEVWLTGANWFGFNCGENCLHYLWSGDVDDMLESIADHGINLLRFPISTELLLSWMNGEPHEVSSVSANNDPYYSINVDFCNEDGSLKNSMEIFDVIMEKCKTYGLKVMVDIHSPTAHNSGHNYNLWYYDANAGSADTMAIAADGTIMTTQHWIDTLVWLADKYKNDDTLIAYDLKNEPHGKGQEGSAAAKWDDSTDENNWAYAATTCANAILEVNPNALIMIEGVEQYCKDGISPEKGVEYYWGMPESQTDSPYYPGWWGGQLRGVREYPIQPETGTSQIVYSPHDYGPSVYAQTWFDKDFTTQTLLDDYWYDTWAFVNAEEIGPLLIGEWGGHMDGAENQKWMELLRNYMIDNHINHTFWCLNTNSGDTGGLWSGIGYQPSTGTDLTWDADKYALFEQSLWQTLETGQYIGLDHQKALGANGLSLNEFYTDYAHTEGSNIDGGTVLSQAGNPVEVGGTVTVSQYSITSSLENCEISLSATKAEAGETVTFTLTPTVESTEAPSVSVATTSGTAVAFDESNGTYSFTMPEEAVKITAVYTESVTSDIVYGDANGDGRVNAMDATLVARHAVGTYTLADSALTACDVNLDGRINAMDATLIARYAVGTVESLPI